MKLPLKNKLPFLLLAVCAVVLLGGATTSRSSHPGATTGEGNRIQAQQKEDTFESTVAPFLKKFCSDCHSGEGAEAGIDFQKLDSSESIFAAQNDWLRVYRELEAGSMPPADAGEQPPPKRKERVVRWLVDHASSSPNRHPSHSPAPRRLTRLELENTLRDLFHLRADPFDNPARLVVRDDYFLPAAGSMPFHLLVLSQNQFLERMPPELGEIASLPNDPPILHGFNNDQSMLSSPPVQVESSLALVNSLLNDPGFPRLTPLWETMFVPQAPDDGERQLAQARNRLETFLDRAFRRPATAAELDRYLQLFTREREASDYTAAMKSVVAAILSSPKFLFRLDRTPTPASAGMPVQYAVASKLSYFLWGSMPDAELFAAAREGRLSREEDVRAVVKRMLLDPKIRNLSIDFGSQWLKIGKVRSARPDRDTYPDWYGNYGDSPGSAMMIEQMLLFETILVENRSIVDFIDADFAYLNITLMNWYQLDPVELIGYQPEPEAVVDYYRIRWPSRHRGGIIGSGAMLASTSATTRTSPVYRGAWLLEVLFNRPAPPPPPNVPALDEGNNPAMAATHPREKLALHRRDPACAVCHDRIDALGFALEKFDPVGRFRKTYQDGSEIDATGELNGIAFDGAARFRNVVLRKKDRFVRGFIEHLSRYAAGRELTLADQQALVAIYAATLEQGSRISAVVEEVAVSPLILGDAAGASGESPPLSERGP